MAHYVPSVCILNGRIGGRTRVCIQSQNREDRRRAVWGDSCGDSSNVSSDDYGATEGAMLSR